MPIYQYTTLDEAGRHIEGRLEAADVAAAAAQLRERSLFIVKIAPAEETAATPAADADGLDSLRKTYRYVKPVRTRDVVFFFRQAASMIRAGMTLLQALDVVRSQCANARLALAVARMHAAVTAGTSLSKAMAAEGRYFPEIAAKLTEAAEATGELDTTLDRVADHLERRMETRNNLITSLIYPTLVVLLSTGVVIFLVTFVIPKLAVLFRRRQAALPGTTQALLDIAAFMQNYGIFILVFLAAGTTAAVLAKRSRQFGRSFDRALLSVPIIGKLLVAAAMAQMGKTLAALLRSGVTLLESLRITGNTTKNRAIAAQFESAAEKVLHGNELAGSLCSGVIPPFVSRMVTVGERTGSLDMVFDEIGDFYDGELRSRIRQMNALFEPTVIVVVGGVVGFVYFAFFQALFQVAQLG